MRTRQRLDWHARLAQSGEISFHRAQADPELAGQHRVGDRPPNRTEKLDQPLLPLNPA